MKNIFLVRRFTDPTDIESWLNKLPSGSGVAALSESREYYSVIVWVSEKKFSEMPLDWENS